MAFIQHPFAVVMARAVAYAGDPADAGNSSVCAPEGDEPLPTWSGPGWMFEGNRD